MIEYKDGVGTFVRPPDPLAESYLSPAAVAKILGMTIGTLAQWRTKKIGPDYYKFGKAVRYRREDVKAFLNKARIRCEGGTCD